MIDLSWRTEATEQDYQKVVRHDAVAFLAWRARATARKALPLEQAFRSWWLVKGRTGFRSTEDMSTFRNDLFCYAQQLKADTSGGAHDAGD